VIGRDSTAEACLDDPGLSRFHAKVFRKGGVYYIQDLESTNGTFLSGQRLMGAAQLTEGDRILVGRDVVLKFAIQDALEQEAAQRLYESAVRDPLTHLYNRRYLDERISGEFAFAMRHGTPLSVIMVDVDHFKKVNDTHGHLAGDEVLKSVATTVQKSIRLEDIAARYGGEEVVVVARGADVNNALALGERIRRMIQKLVIPWENEGLQVTVSVGIATRTPDKPYATVEALIAAADSGLYVAKESGRNKVIVSK
jgi:diguanylate cyclase (GGDEF)-like protein